MISYIPPVRVDIAAPAPASTKETPDAPGPPGLTRRDPRRWAESTVALYRANAILAVALEVDELAYSKGTVSEAQSRPVPQEDHDKETVEVTRDDNIIVKRVMELAMVF